MTESSDDLKRMISEYEEKERQASVILTHLRAALAEIERVVPVEERKLAKPPKKSKGSVPFAPKYDVPASALMLEELGREENLARGLSLRSIQNALVTRGKTYSDQALTLALKKLIKAGKVTKVAAPEGSISTWHYKLIIPKPVLYEENAWDRDLRTKAGA